MHGAHPKGTHCAALTGAVLTNPSLCFPHRLTLPCPAQDESLVESDEDDEDASEDEDEEEGLDWDELEEEAKRCRHVSCHDTFS